MRSPWARELDEEYRGGLPLELDVLEVRLLMKEFKLVRERAKALQKELPSEGFLRRRVDLLGQGARAGPSGDLDAALEALKGITAKKGSLPEAHFFYGRALREDARYGAAKKQLRLYMSKDPLGRFAKDAEKMERSSSW